MSLSDALVVPVSAVSHNQQSDVEMRSIPATGQPPLTAEGLPEEDEEMEDLFGEHNDRNVQKPESDTSPSEGDAGQLDTISDAEQRHREAMEYAEPDDPDQDPNSLLEQHTEANAAIPNIPIPKSSDGQNWVIRMPNFVKVDSKPFHPDTYIGPEQEEEDVAPTDNVRERSMSIKLKVENTLRWRWIKDERGNDQRQSNSRVIRWSDGTLSLLLGKELFDISQQIDNSLANPRTTINGNPEQQSQSQTSEPPGPASQSSSNGAKNQGLTYLVAQHKRAEILQSEALITGYMTLRPTGMQSETHRMLVRAVGQKHNKVARLRMAPDPTTDPEREKMELLKSSAKSKTKRPKYEDDGFGGIGGSAGSRRRRSFPRKRGDGVWSDDDDEDDDAEHDVFGVGSDEDENMVTARKNRGAKKNKRSKVPAGDARTSGDYQTDDFVVSDSPSDDGDGGSDTGKSSKKKRKRRNRSEELEEDDLDKLEAKIEAAERRRENAAPTDERASGEQVHEADEMDIESEEPDDEEEEHQVRKAGAGGGGRTRRLAADLEEEEEE